MKLGISGPAFIALGLILAAVPLWILPVCDHGVATAMGTTIPMRCHWTGRAELGLGLLVACGGLAHCLIADRAVRLGISLMQAGAAVLAMALPTVLIGVCKGAGMPCHAGTRPALLVTATLILLLAIPGIALRRAA